MQNFVEVALPLPLDRLFTYSVPQDFSVQLGHFVWVPFGTKTLKGIAVKLFTHLPENSDKIKPVLGIIQSEMIVPRQVLDLTYWLAQHYACSWGEALSSVLPGLKKTVRAPKEPLLLDAPVDYTPFKLSQAQNSAVEKIAQTILQKTFHPYLLFGVTGSGKTEVFLRAIECALKQNRQALFLVPQVALCVPFLAQLKSRFGSQVGVWHFQVAQGAKNALYQKIASGQIKIVVGARSAMFAPFRDLGCVIVDEEHDSAYKQEEKPRYHAREVAWKLSQLHKAALVLGSATPSIESFCKAQKNKMTLLELPARVGKSQMPQISIVDRKIYRAHYHPFTPVLKEKINGALLRRQQVILALNRRGFSTYVLCMLCAYVWKCPNCKIPLIHHQKEVQAKQQEDLFKQDPLAKHFLQCHYCFHEEAMPLSCQNCKSEAIHFGGFGTQKIVQELKKMFPFARLLRLDRDALSTKKSSHQTFETFKNEEADILVGTQMVTQGYDFPKVTLVGIVDADTALFHPDFRAAERTFQWVVQAAGRAGRAQYGGEAIVQTSMPDHYALVCAQTQNYRAFYSQEIALRKELRYPPYRRLILLQVQGPVEGDLVVQESLRLKKMFLDVPSLCVSSSNPHANVELLGPGPSPKEWINKQLRWQLLVKCATMEALSQCTQIAKTFDPKRNIRYTIDVDPV